MTAQLVRSESQTLPRGAVTYSIWVWSTVPSRLVTVTVSTAGRALGVPTFGLCPARAGETCSIGSMPAYQAFEVLVTDQIGKKATTGEQITMTAVVQGDAQSPSNAALSPAEAAVSTVLGQRSSSSSSPTGSGTAPTSIPGLPGTTVTPGGLSGLFPTVTPSPTPSAGANRRSPQRKVARVTSTASSLPLDTRLIGGQLAGLAVLAAAVTMVMARLSLRTPQPALASTPAPETPAPESPAPQSDGDAGTTASAADASEPSGSRKPANP